MMLEVRIKVGDPLRRYSGRSKYHRPAGSSSGRGEGIDGYHLTARHSTTPRVVAD